VSANLFLRTDEPMTVGDVRELLRQARNLGAGDRAAVRVVDGLLLVAVDVAVSVEPQVVRKDVPAAAAKPRSRRRQV
jgi:hypothetical protein